MKKKKKSKLKKTSVALLLTLVSSIYLIKNILLLTNIENNIRTIIIIIIILLNIILFLINRKVKRKKLFIISNIIIIVIFFTTSTIINKLYDTIDNINKNHITYSTSLIALKSSEITTIEDVYDLKIGTIDSDSENNDVNYQVADEMIKNNKLDSNNEIVKYDDIQDLLKALYKKEVDVIFISSNYNEMFNEIEEFANINNDVEEIINSEKTVTKEKSNETGTTTGKNLTKPFTILLMGVDSEKEGLANSSSNGDSLILISFNPTTLNATMLSIPRDSYVPIMCFKNNRESKLTHAGWYGSSCMMNTINNFLDINIDYYVKINFKGVVSLVNALDGINVDVPADLCTDSSSRTGKVCISKGNQNLDGEGALVLARNRYDLPGGDLARGQNQQLLFKAILNKMKTIRSVDKLNEILDTISNNMDTNLTVDQILSCYDVFKSIIKVGAISDDVIHFEKQYLEGSGQMIYDEGSKLTLWNYVLKDGSIEDVSNSIKENLDTTPTLIKKFNYNIEENYISPTTGKGKYETTTYTLLPNFVGSDKSVVDAFCKKNNIKVIYTEKEDNSSSKDNNEVLTQNYNKNTRVDKIDTLKITVLKKTIVKEEKKDCSDVNNTNNECLLPSFIGMTKTQVESYLKEHSIIKDVKYNEVSQSENPTLYSDKKEGTIVSQNYKVNTQISKVKGLELTIITK